MGRRVVRGPGVVIDPNGMYSRDDLRQMFGLTAAGLSYQRREHGLRSVFRLGRVWFPGDWLLDWFRAGEQAAEEMREHRAALLADNRRPREGAAVGFEDGDHEE